MLESLKLHSQNNLTGNNPLICASVMEVACYQAIEPSYQ